MRYYPLYSNHSLPSSRHYRSHTPFHFLPYYRPFISCRNVLPVNPSIFMNSARLTQMLLKDGGIILEKLAVSKTFSGNIITAAQSSDKNKVVSLLQSTGIQNTPKVSYTPNGLTLSFVHEENQIDCCHLILKIRWG
nr:hypothetical protein [uncultured Bacillus sp.]